MLTRETGRSACEFGEIPGTVLWLSSSSTPLPLKYLSHHPTVSVSDDIQYYVTVNGLHQCFSTREPVGV